MVDLKERLEDAELIVAPDLWGAIQERVLQPELGAGGSAIGRPTRHVLRHVLATAATIAVTVAILALLTRALRSEESLPATPSPSVFSSAHGMLVFRGLASKAEFSPSADGMWQMLAVDPITGEEAVVLPDTSVNAVAWSADGNRLLLGNGDILNADGSVTHLLDARQQRRYQLDGSFSPDGLRIVYAFNESLFIVDSSGEGPRTELTHGAFDPNWSPDGSAIAFWTSRGSLEAIDPDGSNRRTVLRLERLHLSAPDPLTWSPDGSQIAFSASHGCCQAGSYRIGEVNADGTGVRLLTPENGSAWPAWAPDGSRIAFIRGNAFFTMASDGSDVRRIPGSRVFTMPFRITWNPGS